MTTEKYIDREIDMNGEEYLKQLRLVEEDLKGIDDPVDEYRSQIESLIYDELDSQIDTVIDDIGSDIESYVAKIGDGALEYELETSRSTQAGRYPSKYIKITNQNDETLEIRLSDGHRNSVGGSTEHTFIDLLNSYSYELKAIKEEIKRWYDSFDDTTSEMVKKNLS